MALEWQRKFTSCLKLIGCRAMAGRPAMGPRTISRAPAIAGALLFSALHPTSGLSQSGVGEAVVMICIGAPGARQSTGASCNWQPLTRAKAQAVLPPAPAGAHSQAEIRISEHDLAPALSGSAGAPSLSFDTVRQVLPGLNEEITQILIWSMHYQAVPDGSYTWRLDEEDPYKRAQYEALGLAQPDLKPLMRQHRFKGAGFRISLRY